MSKLDRWLDDDGEEPEELRSFLDALRNQASSTSSASQATESMDMRLCEKLEAELSYMFKGGEAGREAKGEAAGGEVRPIAAGGAPPAARRVANVTLRCEVAELVAMAPPSAPGSGPPSSALPPLIRALPSSLPQVARPPAALVETARSMEWAVPRGERGARRRPGGVAVVPFPPMTVVQYASLCAELAMWPGWTGAILGKYGVVGEEARGALDDHWQARWRERPEERAEYEWAFGEYTAWLREHAGQGR